MCYSTVTRAPESLPRSPHPVVPSGRVFGSGPYHSVSVCLVFVGVHHVILFIYVYVCVIWLLGGEFDKRSDYYCMVTMCVYSGVLTHANISRHTSILCPLSGASRVTRMLQLKPEHGHGPRLSRGLSNRITGANLFVPCWFGFNLGVRTWNNGSSGPPKTGKKFHCWPSWPTVKLAEKFNFPKPQCGAHISYCFTVNSETLTVAEALRCGRPYPQTPPPSMQSTAVDCSNTRTTSPVTKTCM